MLLLRILYTITSTLAYTRSWKPMWELYVPACLRSVASLRHCSPSSLAPPMRVRSIIKSKMEHQRTQFPAPNEATSSRSLPSVEVCSIRKLQRRWTQGWNHLVQTTRYSSWSCSKMDKTLRLVICQWKAMGQYSTQNQEVRRDPFTMARENREILENGIWRMESPGHCPVGLGVLGMGYPP
jgi:hypothetical protein